MTNKSVQRTKTTVPRDKNWFKLYCSSVSVSKGDHTPDHSEIAAVSLRQTFTPIVILFAPI
jgi:hypothetical protein